MIPFVDVARYNSRFQRLFQERLAEVCTTGRFSGGEELAQFEKDWAAYCGTKFAAGCGSGTDALKLALLAMDVRGKVVLAPANTFAATVAAACQAGAHVELLEVEQLTRLLDMNYLERFLKTRFACCPPASRPSVIIPVHLYGQMADMYEITRLANRYDMRVLEDACQAHGATYFSKPAGSFGHAAAFSFYPAKNLGALGDGGAVVSNDELLIETVKALRVHGQFQKNEHTLIGYTSRLDELQAAFLNAKLPGLDKANAEREVIAKEYTRHLGGLGDLLHTLVLGRGVTRHAYHVYAITLNDQVNRFPLQRALEDQGIHTGIHYPVPIHMQPAFRDLGYREGDFPHAERMAYRTLSLPIYPGLHPVELQRVVKVIKQFKKV